MAAIPILQKTRSMRVWRSTVASAALFVCASVFVVPLHAQTQTKVVGNWQVTIERDPFRDAPRVFAVTGRTAAVRLAIQCYQGNLMIDLGDMNASGAFLTGENVTLRFRADRRPIIDAVGVAINDRQVRIDPATEMVRQIVNAKEIAFEITRPQSWPELIYKPTNSVAALAPLIAACPLR